MTKANYSLNPHYSIQSPAWFILATAPYSLKPKNTIKAIHLPVSYFGFQSRKQQRFQLRHLH